ncbi:MAG: isochorismatase [uncultured bacterium]|nr:MAG: isochorismatase [uncultured bacterium]
MNTALILIDIQNDYFPGGNMELVGIENAASNARQLLNKFRNKKSPIFHIQHVSIRPNATFFIPDTKGVDINDYVKPNSDEAIITKHYPNSFRDTDLHEKLKQHGIEKLIICGAMSHMCVDSTTRAAFDLGYKCIVISDACATKDLSIHDIHIPAQQVHAAYMAGLHGIFSEVVLLSNLEK